jgi:hypothetical protein
MLFQRIGRSALGAMRTWAEGPLLTPKRTLSNAASQAAYVGSIPIIGSILLKGLGKIFAQFFYIRIFPDYGGPRADNPEQGFAVTGQTCGRTVTSDGRKRAGIDSLRLPVR